MPAGKGLNVVVELHWLHGMVGTWGGKDGSKAQLPPALTHRGAERTGNLDEISLLGHFSRCSLREAGVDVEAKCA